MKNQWIIVSVCLLLLLPTIPSIIATSPGVIYQDEISINFRNVTVYAPAVAQTDEGYVGVISTITVTIQNEGSGRVFVDTLPLTQIDMQGSARLAVKVASSLVRNDERCENNPDEFDYFFVVRTTAPIIGGPSAGAVMTTAVIALLENWEIDNETVMTGMINPDGSIGPIGGIPQKIDAANSVGATRFLIPKGQGLYTEMVTETVSNNGWAQVVTRPVTRNVSDYALEKYGIEVIEVEDIEEAVLYFTGWEFSAIEPDDSISTEAYIDSMKPLASSLLNESKESYKNASEAFNTSDIPNLYPNYYKDQIEDFLDDAEQNLKESEDWYSQELYYTSTSNSFQSLIDSHFVSYACDYFSSDDGDSYVQSLLAEAKSVSEEKSEFARTAEISGLISLQTVGAAQKRASDAESYLSDAEASYSNGDYLSALYRIAFAIERSDSVEWWIDIASPFNETGDISSGDVQNLAVEYIEDAQQAVVYSGVILQELGTSSSYLTEAEDLLDIANNDKENGYYAAALFESFESLVKANLALELVDSNSEDKVERARESASTSISESRYRGIEPVLAVSYYEYAQSLVELSLYDVAIVYFKYSDLIAGALSFTSTCGGHSSRYVGIPEITLSIWDRGILRYFEYFIFTLVIGIFGGFVLGIVLERLSHKKQENKVFYEEWVPRSIKDYYKKKK